jgi:hypothetical protein
MAFVFFWTRSIPLKRLRRIGGGIYLGRILIRDVAKMTAKIDGERESRNTHDVSVVAVE